MRQYSPSIGTLGPVSAYLLKELSKRDGPFFTLDQASAIYGREPNQTAKFLSSLIKRGVLARVSAGVYLVLQPGQEDVQLSNWPLIARVIMGSDDYFLSHYSAMRIHGMTTHSLVDAYITVSKKRAVKTVGNITYHFIYCKSGDFWGWGDYWATKQQKIYVSDIQKTLLDGFERPDLCGGIKEIVRGIGIKHKEIDWDKMVKYAENFRTKAAVKRLGFILEMLEIGMDHLPSLEKIIAAAEDYIFLDPSGSKEGKYCGRWRIRLNMNVEELKSSVWE